MDNISLPNAREAGGSRLRGGVSFDDISGGEDSETWDPNPVPKPKEKKRRMPSKTQKKPAKRRRTKLDAALDHVVLTDDVNGRVQGLDRPERLQYASGNLAGLVEDLEAEAAAMALANKTYRASEAHLPNDPATQLLDADVSTIAQQYCDSLRDRMTATADVRHPPATDSSEGEKDERIKALERELAKTKELLGKKNSDYDSLEDKCSTMGVLEGQLRDRLGRSGRRNKDLMVANQALKDSNEKLTNRIGFWMPRAVAGAFQRIASFQRLSNFRDRLTDEQRNLETHRRAALDTERKLEAEGSKWRQRATAKADENVKLSARINDVESELRRASEQLRFKMTLLLGSNARVQEHEQTISNLGKTINDQTTQLQGLQEQVKRLQDSVSDKEKTLLDSRSRDQEHEQTISKLGRTINDQTTQLQGLQEQVKRLQDGVSDKETRLSEQIKKAESLGNKLSRTSDLHLQTNREKLHVENEKANVDRALQKLTQQHKKSEANLTVCLDEIGRMHDELQKRQDELDAIKRSLSRAEERAISYDRRNQEDRDNVPLELQNLLGVSPGAHHDTLRRLNVDSITWPCDKPGHHRGCLIGTSSLLHGRPPMVVHRSETPPPLAWSALSQATLPAPLVKDVNYKLVLTLLYLSTPGEKFIQLLWGIWAVLEGIQIHSDDVAAVACAVTSVAKRIFQLSSDDTVSDLGFWITAQIVCSLLPWGFDRLDLNDVLPSDHPSHQTDRPLVSAALSRLSLCETGSQHTGDRTNDLFVSLETCAARFPDLCKSFGTLIDGNPAKAVLCNLPETAEVLVLVQTVSGDCVLWHDKARPSKSDLEKL
ncbi:MAG: hypothetical protein LQ338_004319 [Usnochroma carphineum]|nr:MAG: hypothetical protein LQ338_004319 [Usnochroma carphineum]